LKPFSNAVISASKVVNLIGVRALMQFSEAWRVLAMSCMVEDLVQKHRWTVSDYHRMGEAGIFHEDSRVELIDGGIIEMPPIGGNHAGTVS
jgi:hypothetical protein